MMMISQSTRKKCYGSTIWELHCLRTALCESIRYQDKSEQNVRQDLIPRVRHGEAALCTPPGEYQIEVKADAEPVIHPPRGKWTKTHAQSGCHQEGEWTNRSSQQPGILPRRMVISVFALIPPTWTKEASVNITTQEPWKKSFQNWRTPNIQ